MIVFKLRIHPIKRMMKTLIFHSIKNKMNKYNQISFNFLLKINYKIYLIQQIINALHQEAVIV